MLKWIIELLRRLKEDIHGLVVKKLMKARLLI